MSALPLLDLPAIPEGVGFEEEHALARQAARRFVGERCPMSEIRRLATDAVGHDRGLHREIAELGWLELALGEPLHLALLLEEMGRVLWPTPFFASSLALRVLSGVPGAEHFRAAIGAGQTVATLAVNEPRGRWQPSEVKLRAEPRAGGYVLSGEKSHVLGGATANLAIVAARLPEDELALFAVELPVEGVTAEPEVCVDTTRRTARLRFDSVAVARESRLELDATAALDGVFVWGATMLACEMVGCAEAVLEKTLGYAIERQQFGRAIGSFQAVKHPIVNTMIDVELGRSLALGAASLLAGPLDGARVASHMAKAAASDLLSEAVKRGVQLHGGFGFTWDCDVHFYFKRSLWARSTLGDAAHHRARLGNLLLA